MRCPARRSRRSRRFGTALAVACGATALLAGCEVAIPGAATGRAARPPPIRPEAGLTVAVEPEAGFAPLDAFVEGASASLEANFYELDDPTLTQLLTARAAAGVRVQVLLDRSREKVRNRIAFAALAAGGVVVRWAPPRVGTDHAKYACADDRRCLVLTGNPVSADEAEDRDFVVADDRPADVATIVATFDADSTGRPVRPGAGSGDLVWSPDAGRRLVALIAGARRSLLVENEEMSSPGVRSALADAAGRGVNVTVVMTCDGTDEGALHSLVRAGASVRCPTGPGAFFIHAKAMVADDRTAYVGSINFSVASMDYNRELGVVTSDPAVVGPVAATLRRDAASGVALVP